MPQEPCEDGRTEAGREAGTGVDEDLGTNGLSVCPPRCSGTVGGGRPGGRRSWGPAVCWASQQPGWEVGLPSILQVRTVPKASVL